MKNATKILFGVVAIAIGIIYFGDVLGFWSMGAFEGWWTLLIIVPSIGSMLSSKVNLGNVVFLIFGIWLFVNEQGWVDKEILNGITISLALVILGVILISSEFKNKYKTNNHKDDDIVNTLNSDSKGYTNSKSDTPSFFSIFGGNQTSCSSKNLCGGEAIAIFGGMDLNLSDAVPNGNVTFNAIAIFGGIDIIPPKGFKVETKGISVLGGCDNKINDSDIDGLPIFTINYYTFCGGIDIVTSFN